MPKATNETNKRVYSLDELQLLLIEARAAGDTKSIQTLSAMVTELGGADAASIRPENETVLQTLVRLRHEALQVGDQDSVDALGLKISELQAAEPDPDPIEDLDEDPAEDLDGPGEEEASQVDSIIEDEIPGNPKHDK